ncbi:hypothetical protein PI95_024195 [Hassallia byssoidea VB512170]|uniref:Uncharacterized protein n=1 Tax=Hassallia byssoidea VB512170 TaxID=1304833 RepID=A0A846HFX5_9CYAN|nr:hypothetical protein [Hassalia byssoidea]NEU75574.1 hypothetical protein [Hassalia byssoidea VB512170]
MGDGLIEEGKRGKGRQCVAGVPPVVAPAVKGKELLPMPDDGRCLNVRDLRTAQPNLCPMTPVARLPGNPCGNSEWGEPRQVLQVGKPAQRTAGPWR